jgi:hypothetical protein
LPCSLSCMLSIKVRWANRARHERSEPAHRFERASRPRPSSRGGPAGVVNGEQRRRANGVQARTVCCLRAPPFVLLEEETVAPHPARTLSPRARLLTRCTRSPSYGCTVRSHQDSLPETGLTWASSSAGRPRILLVPDESRIARTRAASLL